MKLTKKKGQNDYTWEGLTLGKLLVIESLLSSIPRTPVGEDIYIFLSRQELGTQDPNV